MNISAAGTEDWADIIVNRLTAVPAIPHDLASSGYILAGLLAFVVLALTYVGTYYWGKGAGVRKGARITAPVNTPDRTAL